MLLTTNVTYLLEVPLKEQIKLNVKTDKLSNWIFDNYSDVFSREIISEKQVIKFIEILKKGKSALPPQRSNVFEPDVQANLSKSQTGFFKTNEERQDEYEDFDMDDIKESVKESNKINSDKNFKPLRPNSGLAAFLNEAKKEEEERIDISIDSIDANDF